MIPRFFVIVREMVSPENPNWLFDYSFIDDIPVPDANFPVTSSSFSWAVQPLNGSPDAGFGWPSRIWLKEEGEI